MEDYSAGHITTEEAHLLISAVDKQLGHDGLRFQAASATPLLVWAHGADQIKTQPPHDISGKPIADYLPAGDKQEKSAS